MDNALGLLICILEVLQVEVFIFSQNPGNIGNLSFSNFSYPGNIGKPIFTFFSNPGNIGNLSFSTSWYPGNIENLFCGRAGAGRGRRNHRGVRGGAPRRGGGGDGVPTTLSSVQTPRPSRPGTKYPVRGQSLTSMI